MLITIITFNNALSYGAMIQAFALKTFLEKQGHNVFIANYSCNGNILVNNVEKIYVELKEKSTRSFKDLARFILFLCFQKRYYQKKIENFQDFRKMFLYATNDTNPLSCDMIICGSDQIWNPQITDGYADLFFGINNQHVPAISYAASVGDLKNIFEYGEQEFIDKIKQFEYVSCRENDLNQFLLSKNICSKLVLDPTLLLTEEDYSSILSKPKSSLNDYVFVFKLGKSKMIDKTAKTVAEKCKCSVVKLNGSNMPWITTRKSFGDTSPGEFLWLIKNAKYVVTDSFHGLALSLVFHKDFNVVLPKLRSNRLDSLLSDLSLENRIITTNENIDTTSINYTKVEKILEKKRKESIKYLIESIRGIK